MKTKIEVQFQERNVDVKDTEKLVKEDLKASGVKMNTIANLLNEIQTFNTCLTSRQSFYILL